MSFKISCLQAIMYLYTSYLFFLARFVKDVVVTELDFIAGGGFVETPIEVVVVYSNFNYIFSFVFLLFFLLKVLKIINKKEWLDD